MARGYSHALLKRAYHKAFRTIDIIFFIKILQKLPLPLTIRTPPSAEPTRLILTFSSQHQPIRDAIEKYRFLLVEDPVLSSYVPPKPSITYRRAKSLKDELVQSHFVDPWSIRSVPAITTPCGACEACQFLDVRNRVTLPNGQLWVQQRAVSCHSPRVIYLLLCPCGDFYVGKTRRPFSVRILEHVTAATSGYFKTTIGRHFAFKHIYTFSGVKFLPLTVLSCHDRGDWDRVLLQAGACWIFRLGADRPPGLNDSISFAPFL